MNLSLLLRFYKPNCGYTIEENKNLIWQDESPKPTEEEIEQWKLSYHNDIAKNNCKTKAKQLIANTDWSVLPDVNITNKSEFESYRNILRNYIINPIENPEFPIEPQPIWKVE